MKEIIKNLIVSNLEHMDVLSEKIEQSKKDVAGMLDNIIRADIKGDSADEFFNNQRLMTAKMYLMEQDLSKVMDRISIYYKLSQSLDGELGLDEADEERAAFMADQESYFFVIDKKEGKTELKARDEMIINTLEERISKKDTKSFTNFLEGLRQSEMYKQIKEGKDTKDE
jgi:uncharacterized protein YukE